MNQLISYNNTNDGLSPRRYAGFPLNSTLVNSYTPDTIRSIITHAATGKPYNTAVWIRVSRIGVQISAQDPQIARARVPVFIPIGLIHDIFMQPTINNIICIVYDEAKSNLKGVLLYVVHPADAQFLRDDFRVVKQKSLLKPKDNPIVVDVNTTDTKFNRHTSPKRIFYVQDNEKFINRDMPMGQNVLPQLNYMPMKNSYHSSRDNSTHRRNKSPRKNKTRHSSTKTTDDNGSRHRRKHRSRSPKKSRQSPILTTDNKKQPELDQEQIDPKSQQTEDEQKPTDQAPRQQTPVWQVTQPAPMVPMGIYSRYVPKAIPLPTGETIKTILPSSNANGQIIAHIEPQQDHRDRSSSRSPSRSQSISPKRQDHQIRPRPLSAQNADASINLNQTSHQHHHRRHHHHHHNRHSSKADTSIYNTISHSSRIQSKYLPSINNINNNNNINDDNDTKQYLKQLINDMQAMKLEMNKLRLASSSTGTTRARSDTVRINLQELRQDIDILRARMVMSGRIVN